MVDAETKLQPYPSLEALRQGNEELLGSLEDESRLSPEGRRANTDRINDFIQRAVASGAVLDVPADRRAAQGMIDYWSASAYSAPTSSSTSGAALARADVMLKPFDAALVGAIAKRGEAVIAAAGQKQQDLARRLLLRPLRLVGAIAKRGEAVIAAAGQKLQDLARRLLLPLLRLVRPIAKRGETVIAAAGQTQQGLARRLLLRLLRLGNSGTFTLSPATRDSLLALGDPQTVDKILAQLTEAGVVTRTPGPQGDLIGLRYEALARQWDRLRKWTDERAKFRDAAQFWDHSGRNKGALLDSALADRAAAYHDLDGVEASFVIASTSHGRHRLRIARAVLTVLLLAIVGIAAPPIHDKYINWWAKHLIDRLASGELDRQDKEQAIRWLASHKQQLDFSVTVLENLNLSGIKPEPSLFVNTSVRAVKFDKADLSHAAFTQAAISNTTFTGSMLKWARFDGAAITSSSFSGANLYRSIFDRTRFKDVDFSRIDIRVVSFRNVTFVNPPNFTETAWWLALGWNLDQVSGFADQYRNDKYQETQAFKKERDERENRVKECESESPLQAVALNDLAWFHAIYGIDLDAGETAIKKAIQIMKSSASKSQDTWIKSNEANFKDTFAYILMQKGRMQDALPLQKDAVDATQDGEMMFRYAITLYALAGEKEGSERETFERDALNYLTKALVEKNYTPSHELYLLSKYITGQLRDKLKDFIGPGRETSR